MNFLKKIGRKKKEGALSSEEVKKIVTDLESICGDDKEIYEALLNIILLDPRKIGKSIREATREAEKFEELGDMTRAKIWYEIAGGLAIYDGNVEKVKEIFSKCEKLFNRKYPILKIPERAVAKAQEYYQKYLK